VDELEDSKSTELYICTDFFAWDDAINSLLREPVLREFKIHIIQATYQGLLCEMVEDNHSWDNNRPDSSKILKSPMEVAVYR
jgi:hypothetical protein